MVKKWVRSFVGATGLQGDLLLLRKRIEMLEEDIRTLHGHRHHLENRIVAIEELGAPEPPPQGIVEPGKVDFNAWTGD